LLTAKACSDYRNIFVSIAATRHALARQDEAMDITSMTIPRYVNEDKSDMRGIKPGWYAMGDDGSLVAGPFDTSEKCVGPTRQKTDRQLHALLVGR
jgi:hypothetical protein